MDEERGFSILHFELSILGQEEFSTEVSVVHRKRDQGMDFS
jgi:hypothetical protein